MYDMHTQRAQRISVQDGHYQWCVANLRAFGATVVPTTRK